ncbi:MAG: hypothetical protein KF744_11640 [Taibaiella sp.]|nr:hypothetical protein [Taibaiella sp.]
MDTVIHRNSGKLPYEVFHVKLFNQYPDTNTICFSISYIMNYFEIDHIKFEKYIRIDSAYVLIDTGDYTYATLSNDHLHDIDSQCRKYLQKKLFSHKSAFITSDPPAAKICIGEKLVNRKFYEIDSDMPAEFSSVILPTGFVVEKIDPPLAAARRSDTKSLKAQKLTDLYVQLNFGSNGVYEKEFFKEFPSSYKELNSLYGFEKDTPSILYYKAEDHILRFFSTANSVSDTVFFRRIIAIALDGHWDADAINYFQNRLQEQIIKRLGLTVYLLRKMPKKDVKSFWFFYFDGPHPDKEISKELQSIKTIDMGIYDLCVGAHKKVLKKRAD